MPEMRQLSPSDLLPRRESCRLMVIDLQERLVAAMPESVAKTVLRNTGILIETAKEFGMPVLVSEQYPQGLGPTMAEIKAALPEGVRPVEKVAFNCCRVPALKDGLGDSDVILCGAELHVCLLQTALDLLAQGRKVYIAADATCSRSKHNWRIGLDLLRQAGAVIGSTEIFAFSLLGGAGTEQFRRISRLVK